MAFIKTASPGVVINEIDLTRPGQDAITSNVGAFAGPFAKGPMRTPVLVNTEAELVSIFGLPTDSNAEYWWSVSNFLEYGGVCYVVRVGAEASMRNAAEGTAVFCANTDDYLADVSGYSTGFLARTAGTWGNSLGVAVIDSGADYLLTYDTALDTPPTVGATVTLSTGTGICYSIDTVNKQIGYIKLTGTTPVVNDTIEDGATDPVITAVQDWYDQQIAFGTVLWSRIAPRPTTSAFVAGFGGSLDAMNLVVYDATGGITGQRYSVLETYVGLSKAKGATNAQGDVIYFVDALTNRSNYIYATSTVSVISAGTLNNSKTVLGSTTYTAAFKYLTSTAATLAGGVDGLTSTLGEEEAGYDKFDHPENYKINYLLMGPGRSSVDDTVTKANYIISIAISRADCIAFVSPPRISVLDITNTTTITDNIIAFANRITSTSYAVLDSGYKQMYDRFADVYRYVPLNPDIAGLMVYTARVAEAWYSPAGVSRGQIRNVERLAYNPKKSQRDQLYVKRVNPVISVGGQGTYLAGDRTALGEVSAFDRINVRALFLILEATISGPAAEMMFQFNNDTNRALFRNLVDPFLREVKAKQGITDYLVVCDTTNNTPEVEDRQEFIADIYVKPSRSINYVTLNFVATRSGVSFAESTALFRGQ